MRLLSFLFVISFITSGQANEASEELQKKLNIVIPRFIVKNKSFKEAISLLREIIIRHDPDKTGINLIYLEGKKTKKAPDAVPLEDPFAEDDPFADPDDFGGDIVSDVVYEQTVHFDFERMPVKECIKYICMSINAKYRIDANAVVVAPPNTPIKINEWAKDRLNGQIKSVEYKINLLKKELDLFQKIQKLPQKKEGPKETLKENVILPKIRFENASLSTIAEYIEKQTPYLTKDKKKISIAIYIPADVKLRNVFLEVNNISVIDLAKYVAEQLGIRYAVEKGEISFREAKKLKFPTLVYQLNRNEFQLLAGNSLNDLRNTLIKFGLSFPEKSDLNINGAKKKITLTNSTENHEKLKKMLDLIED